MKYWIAFYSQTGSEIREITEQLGIAPDIIICNRQTGDFPLEIWMKKHYPNTLHLKISNRPNVNEYFELIDSTLQTRISPKETLSYILDNTLISLNGYLRIIPPEVCNKYRIFNGHPGDILTYPHLKGKDPQMKAWEYGLLNVGSVIHECTEELDGGQIVARKTFKHSCASVKDLIKLLHKNSVELWVEFLRKI